MRPAVAIAACAALVGCGAADQAGPAATRGLAPPSGQQKVVWAVGDGADGDTEAWQLARLIAKDRPARFLYLGDVYPYGSAADFLRGYTPVYGALRRITEPTPGNHDWSSRRQGYLPYWRATKGRAQPRYYAFRLAGWELLSLNSETRHAASSAQLRWLRARLAAPGTCRLAFWHRPRYSAGTVHGDQRDTAPLWSAVRGHARLVVNGHEHNLQRFRPRDGITEYVAGAGAEAASLYGLRRDPRVAFARTHVTGALRIVLEPGKATLEFRSLTGKLLDRSRATCRPSS